MDLAAHLVGLAHGQTGSWGGGGGGGSVSVPFGGRLGVRSLCLLGGKKVSLCFVWGEEEGRASVYVRALGQEAFVFGFAPTQGLFCLVTTGNKPKSSLAHEYMTWAKFHLGGDVGHPTPGSGKIHGALLVSVGGGGGGGSDGLRVGGCLSNSRGPSDKFRFGKRLVVSQVALGGNCPGNSSQKGGRIRSNPASRTPKPRVTLHAV